MSHWLPVSTSANERSYNPCPGCSFNIPALSKKSAIKQRCNSEKCFFNVSLSDTVVYLTRNAKVFACYLPITLSTSWSYATSLALVHFANLSSPASSALFSSMVTIMEDDVLPLSVCKLYTDGSFFPAKDLVLLLWLLLGLPLMMMDLYLTLHPCASLHAFLQLCVLRFMQLYQD
ncbi:hypothetical protein GLOIN_2v1785823 [Rhizophagus irregularis DAOM 181602=DAOM 197198]|nr:hypothetical protein GLOIN_2v1785823 [Rhizophagus irregularis DAOM 181602=DAOM 197198]